MTSLHASPVCLSIVCLSIVLSFPCLTARILTATRQLEQRHRTMPASVVEAQQKKEAEQKQEQKQEQEAAQKQGKVQRKEQPRQRRASVAGHVPVRRSARRMTATEIDTSFGRRASRIGQLSSRAESGLDSVNGDEHHTDIDGESLNLPASVDASRRASAHHSPTRRARRPSARDHPLVREALAVQPELASNLDLQTESQRPLVTERDRLLQAAEVEDLEWDMACANDPELRKILRERRVSTISDHSQEDGDGDVGHRRGSMRRPSGAMSVGRHRRRPSRASTVWAAYPHDEEEDQIVKVQVREDGEEEEEETASSRALAGLILEEDEDSPLSLGSSPSRVRGSLSPLGRLSVLSTRSSIFDTTPPPQSTPPPSFQVSLPPSSPKRSPYSHGLSSSSRRESIVESNLLNLEVRDWHQPNKWDP
ncbi:uncharacterized protein MONBRDRAFT_12036 [Monosiga brevicollis MX1]|uniref:Uncharacterized protein n=1 Tax=Monosiga brevicollis TaxID=81824 RepID=A9VB12_MONBE|nr:uncharacterized protein MONBRDRAFT_12036 [Monosiga brevicollis MX1]EDQ85311.1 predicted protein [Monosiga brevicollis MX1]|eukprot:XP_001749932.1 hypothetical protein [Monosiga brevicollis MX1]